MNPAYKRIQVITGKYCPDLADVLMAIDNFHKLYLVTDDETKKGEAVLNGVPIPLSTPVSEWGDETLEAIIKLIE
jgi:hypothetical protein